MNKRLLRVVATLAVSLLLPATLGLPVYAESGSGGSDHSTSTSTDNTEELNTLENKTTTESVEKPSLSEAQKVHLTKMTKTSEVESKSKGKELLTEARKTGKEHTREERLKNCTQKKSGIQTKISNLKSNSAKHLAKIDSVLVLATNSQAASPTIGIDTLLATAKTAQSNATASVEALSNLSATIDCTSDSVAGDVATIKAAADTARTDLKAYREAVKVVLTTIETTDAKKEGN